MEMCGSAEKFPCNKTYSNLHESETIPPKSERPQPPLETFRIIINATLIQNFPHLRVCV